MATYYVSTTGNNGAAGTLAAPWRWLSYAYTRVSPGDTVYVRGGTYVDDPGTIDFVNKTGTALAKYTFRAYGTEIPIFQGTDSGTWAIANCDYVEYYGLRWTRYQQAVYVGHPGFSNPSCTYIVFSGCHFYNTQNEGWRVASNSSYVTLVGCTIDDTGNGSDNGEGVYVGSSESGDNTHHIYILNNTIGITKDEGCELKEGTHDCVVDGNTFNGSMTGSSYSNGGGVIEINSMEGEYVGNPNHIVRNNTICNITSTAQTKYMIHAYTGCSVYNNLIYNIGGSYYGIYIENPDGDAYTRYIYHNTIDLPTARAVVRSAGAWDSKNNIGPATTNNMATSDAYYVDKANGDYRILKGQAPLTTASTDLRATVPTDRNGVTRLDSTPTFGCYEQGVVKAASCSYADVNAAVTASANGDLVWVPAGSATWASALTISKGITLEGRGVGLTTITRGASALLTWNMPSATYGVRWTGFTINCANNGNTLCNINDGFLNGFRIDHITFSNCRDRILYFHYDGAAASGVVDNCTFVEVSGGSKVIEIEANGSTESGGFAQPHGLGTNRLTYVEDCIFTFADSADGCQDASGGARYSFRYNTVTNTNVEHHGCDSGGFRGTMAFEEYNNTFARTSSGDWRSGYYRSGVGLVFNNTLTGNYSPFAVTNYRSGQSFAPWGNCNGSSAWDQNTGGMQGYACLDQIGHVFGATTGGTNTLLPVMFWNNSLDGAASEVEEYHDTDNPLSGIHVVLNRDFYVGGIVAQTSATSPFNGTSGVGFGLLARRPTTCTTGVGYWATDEQKLYRATATNTWTESWTPYTYPHPLRNDPIVVSGGTTPAAPPTEAPHLTVR